MQNAILYTRVSTEDQVAGTSLTTQERDCRAWCERNGYTVERCFTDAGDSAKTADRPQFLALMDWVCKHKPAACIVWKFDRFARNSTDHGVARAHLARYGTRLVSATEATADDPAGRLLETILSGIAQFDNEVRAERVKRSMREVARRGGWWSIPPYGFRSARAGALPILVEIPEQASIVRDLFAGLAEHRRSLVQTVAAATDHGLPGNTVREMLRRTVYAGFFRGPMTGGAEVQSAFPGLVSREAWEEAQAVMDGRVRVQEPRQIVRDDFPLRGFLICHECGSTVTAGWTRGRSARYPYYQCRRGHVRARAEAVNAWWCDLMLEAQTQTIPVLNVLREEIRSEALARHMAIEEVERNHAANVERALGQKKRLVDLYASGAITRHDFDARAAKLDGILSATRTGQRNEDNLEQALVKAVAVCIDLLSDPVSLWQRLNTEQRRRFARVMFGQELTLTRSGICRTGTTPSILNDLRALSATDSDVVGRAGALSNLREAMYALYDLAA